MAEGMEAAPEPESASADEALGGAALYVPPAAPSAEDLRVAEQRKLVLRAIDTKVCQQDDASALGALRTARMLAVNILEHPDEPKYHRFKSSNASIHRKLLGCPGGRELIRAMLFGTSVVTFEEWWVADTSPFGMRVLGEARELIARYEGIVAAAVEKREAERAARFRGESAEKAQILQQIEGDKADRRDRKWR